MGLIYGLFFMVFIGPIIIWNGLKQEADKHGWLTVVVCVTGILIGTAVVARVLENADYCSTHSCNVEID